MLRMARFHPNCGLRRVNYGGHMTRAITSVGGSPLLFTLRHEGQQGGAGLQSSGRAFEYLLPFALILLRNLRLVGLSAVPVQVQGSQVTNNGSRIPGSDHEPGSRCAVCASRSNSRDAVSARYRDTIHCLSNRNNVRIEIAVTYSKQTRGTNSNRNSFRGSPG
jgi:hypothetical protein